jgi:hypothetical protein
MYTHALPKPAPLNRDGAHATQQPHSVAATTQAKLDHGLNDSAPVQAQIQMGNALNQSPRAVAQAKLVQMMSDMPEGQGISDEEELIQSKSAVQRQDIADEDELLQQMPVQRVDGPDEDELLQQMPVQREATIDDELTQMKAMPVQRVDVPDEDELLQQMPVQRRTNSNGMPEPLKAGIESLSGMSMDSVQVHYNSPKPASLQAHAYAQGSDIHVAPGQEQHLPHEAWHVVQQAQGRVQPTMQLQGTAINNDGGLEREADVMGAKAMQLKRSS